MTYDVVIVGAGPAGAFLAYRLAAAGLAVRVVDKEPFPREKVCGGGISYKTEEVLTSAGIDISPVIHRQVKGCFLSFCNRDTVVRELGQRSGKTVLRAEFDALILQAARNAGASFLDRSGFVSVETTSAETLTIQTTRETLQARYLVGADGVFSAVRRRCFGRGVVQYQPALEALLRVPDEDFEVFRERALFDFGAIPRGYAWVFPKQDHLNVGIFAPGGASHLRRRLDAFIALYPQLSKHSTVQYRGYCIPVCNTRGHFESGRVWLIGDAAGLAESFYGEGIYYALRSADAAASTLRRRFAGEAEQTLSARLDADGITQDLRYSRLNAAIFYYFQRFGFYHLVRNECTNALFAELLAGAHGHRACFYQTLRALPRWLPRRWSDQQINAAAANDVLGCGFYAPPNGVS